MTDAKSLKSENKSVLGYMSLNTHSSHITYFFGEEMRNHVGEVYGRLTIIEFMYKKIISITINVGVNVVMKKLLRMLV